MKHINIYLLSLAVLAVSCSRNDVSFGDRSIEELVGVLTVEQKANMVVGPLRGIETPPYPAPGMPVRQSDPQNTNLSTGEVKGAAAYSYAVDSLFIPSITYADGPAGVRIDPMREGTDRTFYCTAFPTGTCLAASWDEKAVEKVAGTIGNEAREYGVDVLLAPGLNIHRNPLCGRNFEYYSEDPYLTGRMAVAYTRGVQSQNVGVSPKHFAVNNQETLRNGVDVIVSERAVREIYLKAFEMVVKEAQPWTVMSSYNKINGVLASENRRLLTDILRNEWGFDGVVMTDWWAERNGAAQQAAGNDLLLPGSQHQYDEVLAGLQDGTLTQEQLDRNVTNILKLIAKTNTFAGYEHSDAPDLDAHAEVARSIGSQGMVLLENRGNTLPLAGGLDMALFGNAGYDTYVGGTGSGNVNRRYKINIAEGLEEAGYGIYRALADKYRTYVFSEKERMGGENFWWIPKVEEMKLEVEEVEEALFASDAAVYVLSRMAGEGYDRSLAEGDYYLNAAERSNMDIVLAAARKEGKKVILLLNMGGMVELERELLDRFDAVLHIWLPGQEAGRCVADVISGKVTPSGKLPFTWAADYADYPSSGDFPLSEGSDRAVDYKEDIYIGYRHFDRSGAMPLYPFGYGLSYTEFAYEDFKTDIDGDTVVAEITVRNTGSCPGRETVQIYVSSPESVADRPVKELKAFGKTGTLKPGEAERLAVRFRKEDLSVFADGAWIIPQGEYEFHVGASAQDIRLTEKKNITTK